MKEETLQRIEDRLIASQEKTIKAVVNGKIDRLTEKLDEHISKHDADWEEIRPFIQGVAGAKILGSGLKWIAGIAIAYLTIKSLFTGLPF